MGLVGFLFACLTVQVLIWGARALDCKDPKGFTISSPQDVASLNKCVNVTGLITISASAPSDIELNGPKSLAALEVTSPRSLRSISSSSLQSIEILKLNGLPNLASLNFSSLNTLDTLQLENLPALENCSFGLGPQRVVTVFNTSLQSVDWLKWPISEGLNISSNANLEEVSLPWETIEGSVAIELNPVLEKVEVFAIKEIHGNFTLAGNEGLKSIEFEELESVDGDVVISGAFGNMSMPALKKAGGALKIESTGDIKEFCDELGKQQLKGKYECMSEVQKADTTAPTSTPPKTPDSGPSPSDNPDLDADAGEEDITLGAKIGIIIASVILGLFLVVGAVFYFRARSRGKVREIVISAPRPISLPSSMPASSVSSPKLERAQTAVVSKASDAGGVRLVLNGEEMRETEGGMSNVEVGKEASLRSVRSVGSEVPLVRH